MYLMKIRHPNFNSDAGAVWRQLFVLCLMPWMRKNRVFSDERVSQAIEALARRKLEVEEDAKGLVQRFGEDMGDLTDAVVDKGTHLTDAVLDKGTEAAAGVSVHAEKALATADASARYVADTATGAMGGEASPVSSPVEETTTGAESPAAPGAV
jgi:hypothetical protein